MNFVGFGHLVFPTYIHRHVSGCLYVCMAFVIQSLIRITAFVGTALLPLARFLIK